MKNIKIIRHVQSLANAGFATKDVKSVWLTDLGREQSYILANNWTDNLENIIHSKYDRTLFTAGPLIDKFSQAKVFQSDLIHEFTFLDPKIFENTNPEQRKPHRENFWKQWAEFQQWKNSENFVDFVSRASDFANYLKLSDMDNVAIFSHEQFITMLTYILESWSKLKLLSEIKKDMYDLFYVQKRWLDNAEIVDLWIYFW